MIVKKIKAKNKIPTEYEEACLLANYLDIRGFKYTHIANETFTPHWGVKMKNKKQGVKKGIPDYLIIVKDNLIFIELKRIKGGTISVEQKSWIEALNLCKNVSAFVARGAEEAINIIMNIERGGL